MTTGNLLYLLMSIGTFFVFSIVLAYASWQQSLMGPETVVQDPGHDEAHGAVSV